MSSINKIAANSPSHANPSELEQHIAQALFDLEQSVADLKSALRPLQFTSAKEVNIKTQFLENPSLPFRPQEGGNEGWYGKANGGDMTGCEVDSSKLALERRRSSSLFPLIK